MILGLNIIAIDVLLNVQTEYLQGPLVNESWPPIFPVSSLNNGMQ